MGFLEIFLVAVGLALDAFAVSLAASASGRSRGARATFRLAFHFGFFQFIMPVAGWFAGFHIAPLIEAADHWVAFGLLAFVGIRMIREGRGGKGEQPDGDPSKGWTLVALSVATSIDALAVGFGLAMIRVTIWYPAVVIGLVAAALTVIGVRLGQRLGTLFGQRMSIAGGVILIGIGLKILLGHLLT